METLIKMSGVPEDVLNLLIARGYFKTKTEAIRAGVLELGKEYHILRSPEELEAELAALKMKKISKEVKQGKRKVLSEEQVKKSYGFE